MNDTEKLLDLFIQPGWKLIMAEMEEAHRVLVETAWTVTDERDLYKRKGEIQKLSEFLNYEKLTKLQLDESETF